MSKFERQGVTGLLLALPLLLAACIDPAGPPETLLWEGELLIDAAAPPDLTGSAAMAAFAQHSEVGIGLEAAPTDAVYGWVLRPGTCDAPGTAAAPASAFPELDVGEDESAEAVAVLQRRLTGTEYAVQVVENADGTGAIIACADLTRRT
jgi:hypothetical protein